MAQLSLHAFLKPASAKSPSQLAMALTPLPSSGTGRARLFLLVEILTTEPELKSRWQILGARLFKEYLTLVKTDPAPFERALEWLNRAVLDQFEPNLWPLFNCLVGCYHKDQLLYASHGQLAGYVFFKENDKWRRQNLTESAVAPEGENEEVFFANLISGSLHLNNLVFFSFANLFDYVTLERLQKLITTANPEQACGILEKSLNQIATSLPLGGLLLASSPEALKNVRSTTPTPTVSNVTDLSIRRLVNLELQARGIELELKIEEDPALSGNESMLQQILLNLVINAYQAITGKG